MIIRKHLKLEIILQKSWKAILFCSLISTSVYVLYDILKISSAVVPFKVVGTLGTAVAIILSFRNSASYDRWWEARKIWGGIVNYSRSFARQVSNFINNDFNEGSPWTKEELQHIHQRLIYRHIAWMNALRLQLRKQDSWEEISEFLSKEELAYILARQNKATHLVQRQAEDLQQLRKRQLCDDFRLVQIDKTLNEFYNLQGKAERIKNTPLARQYDFFPRVFLTLFMTLLPFGLIESLAKGGIPWMVIPLSTAISFVFYVIMKTGEFNEDPFENTLVDTPMTALCRTIEIDLREILEETELPPKVEAIDGILM